MNSEINTEDADVIEAAPSPKFDTFVFDLDGTLLDTLPDLTVHTNNVLAQCGYPTRTRDEILSYVGNGAAALMYQAVPEGTPVEDAEAAIALWKAEYASYPNDLTFPYKNVVELLAELHARGCKVGVASNKFGPGVVQILDKCLPGMIDAALGEGDGVPRKPDPTMLRLVIDELGSSASRTMYIGDSPTDIECAIGAGTFSGAVTWGYHQPEDFAAAGWVPDVMLDDPLDILRFA